MVKLTLFTAATLLTGAGLVSGLSSTCKSALLGIVSSPSATCLNPSGILPIFLASADTSFVKPVDSWLSGLCAQPACSNATLTTVVTNITTGCAEDLSPLGYSNETILTAVLDYYPTVRKVVCLRDDDANEGCITETLTGIQDALGTLSINTIMSVFSQIIYSIGDVIPTAVRCSKCVKKAYNIVNEDVPYVITDMKAQDYFSGVCGASFTNGSDPSGVSDVFTSATGSSSSALPMSTMSSGVILGLVSSVLLAVSSGIASLA